MRVLGSICNFLRENRWWFVLSTVDLFSHYSLSAHASLSAPESTAEIFYTTRIKLHWLCRTLSTLVQVLWRASFYCGWFVRAIRKSIVDGKSVNLFFIFGFLVGVGVQGRHPTLPNSPEFRPESSIESWLKPTWRYQSMLTSYKIVLPDSIN